MVSPQGPKLKETDMQTHRLAQDPLSGVLFHKIKASPLSLLSEHLKAVMFGQSTEEWKKVKSRCKVQGINLLKLHLKQWR